jgi:hypothetical protein
MKRTTILVDDALLIEARSLAQQRAMTFTALVKMLLANLAGGQPPGMWRILNGRKR